MFLVDDACLVCVVCACTIDCSKGMDYLVEMELGNAPPVEYILANMNGNAHYTCLSYPAVQLVHHSLSPIHTHTDSEVPDETILEADDSHDINKLVAEIEKTLPSRQRLVNVCCHTVCEAQWMPLTTRHAHVDAHAETQEERSKGGP